MNVKKEKISYLKTYIMLMKFLLVTQSSQFFDHIIIHCVFEAPLLVDFLVGT